MSTSQTDRWQATSQIADAPTTIAEIGAELARLWPLSVAWSKERDEAETKVFTYRRINEPAALYEMPTDSELFNAGFFPAGRGVPYRIPDDVIEQLEEALHSNVGQKIGDRQRARVETLVAARYAWRRAEEAYRDTVGFDQAEREQEEVDGRIFELTVRLRDLPTTTIDEMRIKAREFFAWVGDAEAERVRNWRDDGDGCDGPQVVDMLLGSLLHDLGVVGTTPCRANGDAA